MHLLAAARVRDTLWHGPIFARQYRATTLNKILLLVQQTSCCEGLCALHCLTAG